MGFTKRELIQFLDGLVESASEENKAKAVLAKEKFLNDFEKTYGYEKEVITEVTYQADRVDDFVDRIILL